MKVLLIAPLDRPYYSGHYVTNALRLLGCNVETFDYRTVAMGHIDRMNQTLKESIHYSKPDFLLTLKGELVNPRIIEELQIPTACWYFDYDEPAPEWLLRQARAHKYFFTVVDGWVNFFKDRGVNAYYLPEAYDHTIIKPTLVGGEDEEKYGSDLAYVGTDKPYHCEVVKTAKAFSRAGVTLKVWGAVVNKIWWKYGIKPEGYRTTDEEFCKICAATKILIGPTEPAKQKMDKCFSARVYQTLGAKGFLLQEYGKGLRDVFDERKLAVWTDTQELLDEIKYYLDNEDERKKMAERGYQFVSKNDTFEVRLKQLLQILEG